MEFTSPGADFDSTAAGITSRAGDLRMQEPPTQSVSELMQQMQQMSAEELQMVARHADERARRASHIANLPQAELPASHVTDAAIAAHIAAPSHKPLPTEPPPSVVPGVIAVGGDSLRPARDCGSPSSPPSSPGADGKAAAAREQVEFYFSEANLARDPYMRRQIEADLGGEGYAE